MKLRTAAMFCVFVMGACAPAALDQDFGARIQEGNEQLLNRGNVSVARDMFAPDFVVHTSGGDLGAGPQQIETFVTELRAAFPDLHVEVEILAAVGDRVVWLRTHRGTHQGDYMGVPASNRVVTWQDMVVTRYAADKIAEEWSVSDLGEQLRRP